MRKVLSAKLHGIHVTETNLYYPGSVTLDPGRCHEAGILPTEFVETWNKKSGARISTYVILGVRGSRCCVLNGAAARICQVGDQLIACSSSFLDEQKIVELRPKSRPFDRSNQITEHLTYSVSSEAAGDFAPHNRTEVVDAMGVQ
ncbi:hypothetical protein WN73_13310 [Bradyrhizobium sp. CCBAU 45394]|uniref:aspartate 1-decarboxylase n=1 Tax=unclassified Bradyrhizobium TaxID=2631580 RepID=UPI002302A6D0|nr:MULTISPECIES: aspartate 1-decarboxylase [unclassified Bradyrhizobium]MDA9391599.1 hypothetical protein [Bradyrhizobium sp. CCBAU 45394]MDA9535746.1 hypothetical protein [Bradyrhizobium sp. CCBAU 21362]